MEKFWRWKKINAEGQRMHQGAAALIEREGTYLLVERRFPPFGFSLVGGHLENDEDSAEGLRRELKEELGVDADDLQLLVQLFDPQGCYIAKHLCDVYSCQIIGQPHLNYESANFAWYSPKQIAALKLTSFTRIALQRLNVI